MLEDLADCVHLQELDARLRLDANAARQEILQMCEGMKRITLPVSTNEEASLPLPYLSTVKFSDIMEMCMQHI